MKNRTATLAASMLLTLLTACSNIPMKNRRTRRYLTRLTGCGDGVGPGLTARHSGAPLEDRASFDGVSGPPGAVRLPVFSLITFGMNHSPAGFNIQDKPKLSDFWGRDRCRSSQKSIKLGKL